ncbi:MAG: EF-P lysine aminoacylase GenX [Gammaproteobacteria bacterium]|nr:EF-P lysine aminoacylase GenX [Gammaproteobacteria bacterium]MBL6998734.1 EF-P lysine aminoacylase GenX [Gammaproteobacteria bacterium]
MVKKIRAFFDARDYLEVDTPLLGVSTNTDIHIQSIRASACNQPLYLQTSPEFAMKRLLVEGSGSIYQICHAFRDEEKGRTHHPEFTLLEWYSLNFDYVALMDQMEQLIGELFESSLPFTRISYFECFQRYLGLDLHTAALDQFRDQVTQHITGIDVLQLSRADCMDLLISQMIGKQFSGFTFIYDYPAEQASLARIKQSNPLVAERFELFYGEMELANGFSELTHASEQRARFERDNQTRTENGLNSYPVDEDFLQALEQGLPDCAGVALGLDRLLMVLLELNAMSAVLVLDTQQLPLRP